MLFLRELGRHCYIDDHHLVATSTAAQVWDTFILDMEDLSRLCTGRDFQLFISVQRRHIDLCAERRLRDIDIEVQDNVIVAALEELVGSDIEDQEQAAVGSTEDA